MPRVIGGLIVVVFLALHGRPAPAGEFEEGLALFRDAAEIRARQGDGGPEAKAGFRAAAFRWEAAIDTGGPTTEIFTNIGNANAFAGDLGPAVLAYRRALVLAPGNDRALNALDSLRIGLGLEDSGESASSGLLKALFFWHHAVSFPARRALFILLWVGGWILVVAARRRSRLRFPAALTLAVAGALVVSLAIDETTAEDRHAAVLLTRTEGRAGDGEFYSPSHTSPLPAGAELRILERRQTGWIHGRLRNGTETWVPAGSVANVLP